MKEKNYEIIGRIRFQEEEEYELSYWDEWLAIDSEGTYHWFVTEDDVIYSFDDYVPESIDMESDKHAIICNGKRIARNDGYVARLVYAEGELSWKPEIGEPTTMYDFQTGGIYYSIEQSEDEVSITAGRRIPFKTVLMAFRKNEFAAQYESTQKKRKSFRMHMRIYLVMAIVSAIFMFRGCLSGEKITQGLDKRILLTENEPVEEEGQSLFNTELMVGPVSLVSASPAYSIKLSVNTSVQDLQEEWESASAMLVRADRLAEFGDIETKKEDIRDFFEENQLSEKPAESYTFEAEFWNEQGYDDEGHWSESDTSVSKDFLLDDPGSYYVYVNLYSQKERDSKSVDVSIEKGVRAYGVFIAAFIFFLLLTAIKWNKSASYNELPFPFYE